MSKILLVEDNPDAVKRIIRYINKIFAELDVVSFPEAGDALQYAKANDISLFILDIQLEDYKGTNLAKQLRELPEYKYTPIIFETALAGEELSAYRDVKCYSFLVKPFGEEEFVTAFRDALGLSKQMSQQAKTIQIEQKQFILEYVTQDIAYIEAFGKKLVIHTSSRLSGIKEDLYYERKNNFLLYIMPRVKIKKYLTAKWIAYALGTLCIIVIPYILSAVFALYVKPPVVPFVENPFSHIFENAFIKTPLLYAVALSLWRGIVSLFVMTFGFVLALYCKNIFVILTGPFMYSILENFVLAILCLERLRLVVAFDPTTVNPEVVSIFSFFFGPIVLSIVIGLTAFLLSKKNAIVTI